MREVIDPNTAMEAAKEGATALTKLQEIIQKIFGPTWTRKQADADAYADQQKLNTIRDNPDMEIIYVDGKMHARQCTVEELSQRAQQRMFAESIRQERNLENVISIADDELSHQNDETSDTPVDEDWITRLFNIVKDVNSEEMQYVWGRILAGEITTPGSFSIRTLEAIRNISKKEAQQFQRLLPYIVRGGGALFITSDDEILKKYGITFSTLLQLEECGLLYINENLKMLPVVGGSIKEIPFYSESRAIIIKSIHDEDIQLSFGIYKLTQAGTELFNVLTHTSNDDYIMDLAAKIRESNPKKHVDISVYKVNELIEDAINYEGVPIKTFAEKE